MLNVFDFMLLRLLDSGASKAIVGSTGWKFLQTLSLEADSTKKTSCMVAN